MSIAVPESARRSDTRRVASTWVAHKFGGTSVLDGERMRHVADVLAARRDEHQVVVVSAMKGTTDALIAVTQAAAARDPDWRTRWEALRRRHLDVARSLPREHGAGAVAW